MMTNEICLPRLKHSRMLQNGYILFQSSFVKKEYLIPLKNMMTVKDSLRVAAVRGSIQTAVNFNECNINDFILLIIFSTD